MHKHEKFNYVEIPTKHINATKTFFAAVFQWTFEDFGPDYSSFSNQGLDGGFFQSELASKTDNGAALLVFYSEDIDATKSKIEKNGGKIVRPIFEFPGGRRFHFTEPSGNEFAVWSDIHA